MPQNIYGEVIPDRIDLNQTVEKEYPKQLIVTIESLDTPNLAFITTLVRNHILECAKSQVNPDIIFNFCIDYFDQRDVDLYIPKFIFLCEYLVDVRNQMPDISLSVSIRGYFLWCMIPFLYMDIPVRMTNCSLVQSYSEGSVKLLDTPIENFITSFLKKEIKRPFKMDKNIIISEKLLTE